MAIFDIIEYKGSNNVLVYRHPKRNFTNYSKLVVRPNQRAILIKDGKIEKTYIQGNYTLQTENIPILNNVVNFLYGGDSPFQYEVYFVNDTIAMNQEWGTASRACVIDQSNGLLLHVGAYGTMGIRVTDPHLVLRTIVGVEDSLTAEKCAMYFRNMVSAKVKEYITTIMAEPSMNYLRLATSISAFSEAVKPLIDADLKKVGIEVVNFYIAEISIQDDEFDVIKQGQKQIMEDFYNKKHKIAVAETEASIADISGDAEARDILRKSQAAASSREIQGYNWADEQKTTIAVSYASSGAIQGNPARTGAYSPTAFAYGQMIQRNSDSVLTPRYSNEGLVNEASKSPEDNRNANFVPENIEPIDEQQSISQGDQNIECLKDRLKVLKDLLDDGLIEAEEYNVTKDAILKHLASFK